MPAPATASANTAGNPADSDAPATIGVLGVAVDAAIFRSAVRWTLNIIALAALGPLAAMLASRLADRHGGEAVTLLVNSAPVAGLFALFAAAAIAVVASAVSARVSQPPMGLTVSGLVVAWVSLSMGDMGDVLRAAGPTAPTVGALMVEGVLVAIVGVCVLHAARSAEHQDGNTPDAAPASPLASPISYVRTLVSTGAAFGMAAGAVGAILGSWLVARDDHRAQAMMAAVVGAIIGGAVARLAGTLLPGGDPKLAARVDIPAIGVLLVAIVAPLSLFIVPGLGDVDAAARAATFTGPGTVAPIDWLVGALLGTSIGVNWGGSLLDREPSPAGKPA